MQIKVQCPAKINLNLKIIGKRPDGFHDIESVMQTVSLYDYLTIDANPSDRNEIILDGNSTQIPYNEKNIVYKAAALYMAQAELNNVKINVYIDKNIPVSAGMAGGSTDAAGVLFGLNHLFNKFDTETLHQLCAKLGSDLNVCLQGGRLLAKGRGELLKKLPYEDFTLSVIKPANIGISAKEAYSKFAYKIENALDSDTRKNYVNDLEWAVFDDYPELRYLKSKYPSLVMTGSGSACYVINGIFENEDNYVVINNISSVPYGVKILN